MRPPRKGSEVDDRVLAVLQSSAASLLKIAQRHSLCDDDAQDAYQRGLEIYLQRLDRVDPATAASWLRTVIKHEAMSIRESRVRMLGGDEVDLDEVVAPEVTAGDDRALAFDRITRAAEALQRCKRDEVAAMVLKADGASYAEIGSALGFSYTKVNRCLTEGRSRFFERYAAIEAGEECERLAPLLSIIVDGEATPVQMADARPHLRNCPACRATLRELTENQVAIHFLLPAALVAGSAGLPDGAAGFFSRAYEMLIGSVHDRLAVSALKAQQAVETVSATKVATVAASAAAVAGGGAVAVERVATPVPAPAPVVERAQAPRPAAVARPAPAEPAKPRAHARPAAARPARPQPAAAPRAQKPRQEFGFEAAAPAAVAASATRAPAAAEKKPRTEDFGFER